ALRRAAYAAGAATNSKAVGHCRRLCVRPYSAVFREGTVWVPNRLGGETPTSCPPHARDQGFPSDERSIGSARSASQAAFLRRRNYTGRPPPAFTTSARDRCCQRVTSGIDRTVEVITRHTFAAGWAGALGDSAMVQQNPRARMHIHSNRANSGQRLWCRVTKTHCQADDRKTHRKSIKTHDLSPYLNPRNLREHRGSKIKYRQCVPLTNIKIFGERCP